ncbi:MAG: 23S rRNA (uracil(1939)-C(5))-methyltransferase RlmD [Clostridia bacterium]|nr:23S rRNA (uracil(1939)-C(5))-methyltransferase RlmD [Clostridia bacterium]
MLKKNDEIEVLIERLGMNGEGIATYDGVVVFVLFALPGERVIAHIIKDMKTYFIAKVVKLLNESNLRTVPPCPYFFKCGGCDTQHLCYEEELNFKQNLVRETIKKYAGIETNVEKTIPSNKQFRYRNKFALPVREIDGEIEIGLFRKNSHDIIPISDCLLQSEKIAKIIKIFKEFMRKSKVTAFNDETKCGIIKHVVGREYGDSIILTVVVTDKKFNNFEFLISELKKEFKFFGLYKNVNTLNNNVIFGSEDEHVFGIKELEIEEFGIRYFVNNRSFMQVNDFIKSKIYEVVLNETKNAKMVVDAYSGAGLLSSIIAKNGATVYGVEIVKEATQNAENLKKINNLNNLNNINGDCAKIIPELSNKFNDEFFVVVDPPRKGLDEKVVKAFIESKPKTIIYISCNPATLARDLKVLIEKYDVEFIKTFDMFPQTSNVETLVKLNLRK